MTKRRLSTSEFMPPRMRHSACSKLQVEIFLRKGRVDRRATTIVSTVVWVGIGHRAHILGHEPVCVEYGAAMGQLVEVDLLGTGVIGLGRFGHRRFGYVRCGCIDGTSGKDYDGRDGRHYEQREF